MGVVKTIFNKFFKVMRKQVFYSMLGMAVLFLVNGCQKQAMDPPYLTLVGESEFTIDANGGPGSVEYRVTNPVQGASVSLSTDPAEVDWVTDLAAASGAVTFNVEVNTAMEERSAKVILSYPQAASSVEFTIKQAAAGKPVINLASTTLSVTSAGGPTSVAYDVTNALEGLTLTVANVPEWITDLEVGEEEISFNVTENTTGDTRSAELTVSYPNADNVKFTVNQFASTTFTINENWTVSYGGRETIDTEQGSAMADIISVMSTDTERYFTSVYTADVFDNNEISAIVEDAVSTMLSTYGPNWVGDFSYTESVTEYYQLFSPGEYRAIAIGIDDNGAPSGLYQLSDKFEPDPITGSDGYNKWLGDWRIEDSEGRGYDITISGYTADELYTMSGWESAVLVESMGSALDIPLVFDPESGSLIFAAQPLYQTTSFTLWFLGSTEPGSLTLPGNSTYLIASSELDETGLAATVRGGSVQYEGDDNTYQFSSMQVFVQMGEKYGFLTNPGINDEGIPTPSLCEVPQFPLTMTKSSASAGASAKSTGLKPVGMKINKSVNYEVPFARLCETNSLAVKRLAR